MGITREFFDTWLKENVGKLPPESEVSPAVLARQFELDADAEGYGLAVREEELGNIEQAIVAALEEARTREPSSEDARGDELAPLMEALEPGDPDSGP